MSPTNNTELNFKLNVYLQNTENTQNQEKTELCSQWNIFKPIWQEPSQKKKTNITLSNIHTAH